MMVAAGSADSLDSASADGEGAHSGGGLAPSRIFTSSRPKLPRARLMMAVVSCSLVVTGPADTSRGANGTAWYAAIHAESAGDRGVSGTESTGDRGVSGTEIAVIHSENSSGDK
jgi:hypothetical protein